MAWDDLSAEERLEHLRPVLVKLGVDPSVAVVETKTVKTIFVTSRWRDEYRGLADVVIVTGSTTMNAPRRLLRSGRPTARRSRRQARAPTSEPDEPEPPVGRLLRALADLVQGGLR